MSVDVLVVAVAAFCSAALTFFSGFGLGTLLMPVVALFFPLDIAVAVTAVVHLANNLFKLGLVGRYAEKAIIFRFGVPALLAAFAGAFYLERLMTLEPLWIYKVGPLAAEVGWVKLIIGSLISAFVMVELLPALKNKQFPDSWMPVGGILSGFLGGLSGHQGALRSMFLVRSGLTREAYLGTGIVIAVLVDMARLGVYGTAGLQTNFSWKMVWIAVVAAFCGSLLCSRFINKVTITGIQRLVSIFLLFIAAGLISGLI